MNRFMRTDETISNMGLDGIALEICSATNQNFHTYAIYALAVWLGMKDEALELEAVDKLHTDKGHMTDDLFGIRNDLFVRVTDRAKELLPPERLEKIMAGF